jgi:hypothetical protein
MRYLIPVGLGIATFVAIAIEVAVRAVGEAIDCHAADDEDPRLDELHARLWLPRMRHLS